MRRVIAISLAILVVAIAARGVMAKDVQRDGNDLLLKILKKRNILSEKQYQEIKGQLASEQNALNQKLDTLDRSMADYLAKAGDTANGNMSYVQNQGVTFSSTDGNWNVYFGGLFQFGYIYGSGDTETPHGGFDYTNRLDFGGHIFDPNLSFYVQAMADSGWTLLDAYIDWKVCDLATLKAGHFKVPYGRQSLVDESDLAFGTRSLDYERFRLGDMGRDTGVMLHNVVNTDNNPNGLAFEWNVGLWNGSGDNSSTDTWLAWGIRAGVYPMGYVKYVESDFDRSPDPKFGLAGSFFYDQTHAMVGDNPKNTSWELDGVLNWNGLYFTAEYFSQKNDNGSTDFTDDGWYVQAGYMVTPQAEVIGRYSMWTQDSSNNDMVEWALGANWYFNGREWKIGAQVGQTSLHPDVGSNQDNWFLAIFLQADW
jgi:hypothetical protein